MFRKRRRLPLFLALVTGVAVAAAIVYVVRRPNLPAQGSVEYEDMSRAFHRGLAALDVGLLDNARQEFTRATQIVPDEPAGWANLGLALIRLGDVNAAADPINHALMLAPRDPQIALLAGRMEI